MTEAQILSPLVFQAGKSAAEVSFPAYDGPWGTCDFMTKECRKNCILKSNSMEREAVQFFEEHDARTVARELCAQLEEMGADTLCWFIGSGDCPRRLTAKVAEIVSLISETAFNQNGFTRNKSFWTLCYPLRRKVRLALTVEKSALSKFLLTSERHVGGLIAVPNYNNQTVSIRKIGKHAMAPRLVGCGGGWVDDFKMKSSSVTVEDCSLCALAKRGCYAT